jgi:hypothetical protein
VPQSRQEIIDLCRRELADVLPATRDAQLRKATVIKEVNATFSPEPGVDRWRPPQKMLSGQSFSGRRLDAHFLARHYGRRGAKRLSRRGSVADRDSANRQIFLATRPAVRRASPNCGPTAITRQAHDHDHDAEGTYVLLLVESNDLFHFPK